jgi:hypothetical protein
MNRNWLPGINPPLYNNTAMDTSTPLVVSFLSTKEREALRDDVSLAKSYHAEAYGHKHKPKEVQDSWLAYLQDQTRLKALRDQIYAAYGHGGEVNSLQRNIERQSLVLTAEEREEYKLLNGLQMNARNYVQQHRYEQLRRLYLQGKDPKSTTETLCRSRQLVDEYAPASALPMYVQTHLITRRDLSLMLRINSHRDASSMQEVFDERATFPAVPEPSFEATNPLLAPTSYTAASRSLHSTAHSQGVYPQPQLSNRSFVPTSGVLTEAGQCPHSPQP